MAFIGDFLGDTKDFLFGSEERESQEQSGPVDVVPGEFRGLRAPVATSLEGLIGGPLAQGGGSPSGESILTAPITDQESQLVSQLGQGNPLLGAAQGLIGDTISGKFLDPQSNPFLLDTIRAAQRSTIEGFQDVALPRFQRGFAAAGQNVGPGGSSAFDRAAAIATRGLTNTLGDIATNIAGQNFQAERGRQTQAISQVSELSSAEVNNSIQQLQAVALPRLIEQFGINQGTTEFNRRIDILLQALGVAQKLPLVQTAQEATASSSGSVSNPILSTKSGDTAAAALFGS